MEIINATSPSVKLSDFEEIVESLERLEVMSVVVQKLMIATADDDFDIDEIYRLIASDSAIAARILRVASSAAFSSRPISNLRAALIRIGMRDVRKLVMASSMVGTRRLRPFRRQLWEYSLRVGATCEALCMAVGVDIDDPFTCGLLHDLGVLVFDRVLGSEYRDATGAPGTDRQLERERERFGFDHCDLGALVARKWRLFSALEAVIQLHHDPLAAVRIGLESSERDAVFAVSLSRAVVMGLSEFDGRLIAELTGSFGMNDRDLAACAASGERRFEAVYAELLG